MIAKRLTLLSLFVVAAMLAMMGCDKEKDATPPQGATAAGQLHGATRQSHRHAAAGGVPRPARSPPKPTGPLPANTSCVSAQCHAELTPREPIFTGPVATQACDSCHGPDTGKHQFPMKRDAVATCTYCHSVAGTQAHQHTALEQGCMTCHKPHISQSKFLLTESTVGQLCARCHTVPVHRFAHKAVADGGMHQLSPAASKR